MYPFPTDETDFDIASQYRAAMNKSITEIYRKSYTGNDSIPFQQFQVLFNSLFKVLFIFPSRYLFAIGLSPIFSFRRYLPPILVCIPKQTDSWKTYHMEQEPRSETGFSPSMMPCSNELVPRPCNRKRFSKLQFAPK